MKVDFAHCAHLVPSVPRGKISKEDRNVCSNVGRVVTQCHWCGARVVGLARNSDFLPRDSLYASYCANGDVLLFKNGALFDV